MWETKILIIDDDAQIRYALSTLFEFQNWKAIAAGDVREGLALFEHEQPDIVLMDYHMPEINGVRGVEMLRAISPSVPIIVFTIDESQDVADAFLDAGASDFALKPIKAPDIVARIKLHLRLLENTGVSRGAEKEKQPPVKGIGIGTLELIESFLHSCTDYVTADQIAAETGLAYQTVYRYLQYLVQQDGVDVLLSYGKVGRPRQSYRIRSFRP